MPPPAAETPTMIAKTRPTQLRDRFLGDCMTLLLAEMGTAAASRHTGRHQRSRQSHSHMTGREILIAPVEPSGNSAAHVHPPFHFVNPMHISTIKPKILHVCIYF